MRVLLLEDLIQRINQEQNEVTLDSKRIKLIRHSMNHKPFKACFSQGFLEDYQQLQNEKFFKGCDYILSFISGPGASAKFIGCYKVIDPIGKPSFEVDMPEGFPVPEMYRSSYCFGLEKVNLFSELEGRLIIDWGKSTVTWAQWGTNEKEVLAIQENPRFAFNGYESIVLEFSQLQEIVNDPVLYDSWHVALASVNAIYLIVDGTTGKNYVGSAYGAGGLLGRWKNYTETRHGGNKRLIALLDEDPDRYRQFQFSMLQVIPKASTIEEVIALESLYKRKFRSIEFGLNDN